MCCIMPMQLHVNTNCDQFFVEKNILLLEFSSLYFGPIAWHLKSHLWLYFPVLILNELLLVLFDGFCLG